MLDVRLRAATAPLLDGIAVRLAVAGVRPGPVTAAGWLLGVGACVAAATGLWPAAMVLWLGNRVLDGLDGAVARVHGPTERGGFLDIVADFSIYTGFVLGVAIAVPSARLACVALISAYYVSGTALLALSSLQERRRHHNGDERSLRLAGGLAEGAETIAVYVLFTLLPSHADVIAWVFAVAVAVTAGQRVVFGLRVLGDDDALRAGADVAPALAPDRTPVARPRPSPARTALSE